MLYTAAKPMPIGDRVVQIGDPVPEVASFEPHVLQRLIDTRWIFAVDEHEGNYDLTYTAGRDMRIGDREVTLDQPCPEVADFDARTLQRLIDNRYVVVTRTLRKEEPHGKSPHKGYDSRARLSA